MSLKGLPAEEKLKALIRIRSTTPPNDVDQIAREIAAFGRSTGASVTMQEVQPGKPNCILTYNFGPGKRVVFNTHMDVNNPLGQDWTFDPFDPFVSEGKLFGLGACDAKGSLAAMLGAVERLCSRSSGLAGQLILTAVMGEEEGGTGTQYLVNQGLHADGAVVGEPTNLSICTVHKGTYMRRLRFRGKAVHSARSHEGINAITHAAEFIRLYNDLGAKLESAPHPILGPANASVTTIQGGTRQNTIPEGCILVIDRRLLPGETHGKADLELAAILRELERKVPDVDVSVERVVATIPSETHQSAPIVAAGLKSASHTTGIQLKPAGFNGGCDMSKLVSIAKIPTIIFGPGSMEQAHAPNEFVSLQQLALAEDVYEGIARLMLSGDSEGDIR